jgi:hypothetical protein
MFLRILLLSFYFREGTRAITAPQIVAPIPPINNHMVLFVGEPVNVRESDELAEFEASIP